MPLTRIDQSDHGRDYKSANTESAIDEPGDEEHQQRFAELDAANKVEDHDNEQDDH